jgi:hypothetical protein
MKTDDLITMLATGATPVEWSAPVRRFAGPLGWGLFGATLLMALTLGVRADIAEAMQLPIFWIKLVVPAAAALASLRLATRLACPGVGPGRAPVVLSALLLLTWISAAVALLAAAPDKRPELIFGQTWKTCPFSIALLSVPLLIAAFRAMKDLAPTRLRLAGGSAGLLAGAASATIYALHCPEMAAPFLGIWYVLGLFFSTAVGAALGPWLLRW